MSIDQSNPLGELVLGSIRKYRDRVAVKTLNRTLTYAQLSTLMVNVALRLQKEGIERGSLVGLNVKGDPVLLTISILAITLLGGRWIEFQSRLTKEKAIGLNFVIHNDPKLKVIARQICINPGWYKRPDEASAEKNFRFPGYKSGSEDWFLAASSGTTGSNKYMPVTGQMFCQRVLRLTEYPADGVPYVACDFFRRASNLASLHFLHTMHSGGTYVFSNKYKDFAKLGINYIIGSPAHLSTVLKDVPVPDSPEVYEVRVVGGALYPNFLATLLKYFQVVRVSYGSTEAGPTTTRLITEYTEDRSVGRCYGDIELEIVDDKDGTSLPAGVEGVVRIRTSTQIEGYIENPEANEEAFREGWFYPGDRGHLSADGELYIAGRVKDQINVAGVKINAALIDEAIQSCEGVVDGMCFMEIDELGIETLSALVAVEKNKDLNSISKKIGLRIMQAEGEKSKIPKNMYKVDKIPRNDNGKIMRRKAVDVVQEIRSKRKRAQ